VRRRLVGLDMRDYEYLQYMVACRSISNIGDVLDRSLICRLDPVTNEIILLMHPFHFVYSSPLHPR
jgi:hypothetical protein